MQKHKSGLQWKQIGLKTDNWYIMQFKIKHKTGQHQP